MDITPIIPAGRQVIEAYGDGGFRISGTRHEGSVLVLPSRTLHWPIGAVNELTFASLEAIGGPEGTVELLLVGCGARAEMIAPDVRKRLRERGIVTEIMDTGAACRTYNVLLSEGRQVAAALIAVD